MNLKHLKPKKALNKAFLKVKPNRAEIEQFKANLKTLLNRTNDTESEEFHKNLVIEFLKKTYYDLEHFINTKGRNDLVIHNGKKAKSSVGVIIEAKKPTNKSEMVSTGNLNKKAFQELVLYYLRERISHKNLEIKHLIATNINEWFIFDSTLFDRLFAQNKKFVQHFTDFEAGRLAGTKTDFFYKQIAEPFIAKIQTEIEFTHFNFQDYREPLHNKSKSDDKKLIALFKLLSPEHLLKLPFANDSNSLDKRFYSELLHIIGLTETKKGSKKLIERNKPDERNSGSIMEDVIIQLRSLDKLSRLNNPDQFGSTEEERLFSVALELTITWINRILFLKLLEAQLKTYHNGDPSYSFLNFDKIKEYDDLNSLFFQVLARRHDERNEDVKRAFEKVPYLNSSLFEPTGLEQDILLISNLKDGKTIPLLSQTVLTDGRGKKLTGELSTLKYLFAFLSAYDFSSEGSEEIQEENKTLINASVLGLIFEKINGYKDGSFFTPGFITMYMCRETIRKAVVQKFNDAKGWNCSNLDQLYNKIESRDEANTIINSLKICDPAVGSGHFLVSALNEIIAVKNDLNILQDRSGRWLKEYQVEVVSDELIVTDEDGGLFEYHPAAKESRRVQEALFHEKQTIIENCLFGVDINSNSVKICRLRLWIELLKNAYYVHPSRLKADSPQGEISCQALETLPNIDINIKCGNSLVSRFPIDADLKQALRKSNWTIDTYRIAADTYRNAENKAQKREMEQLIDDITSDFRTEISANDPKVLRLKKLDGELVKLTTQQSLFDMTQKGKAAWEKNVEKLTKQSRKLEAEIEAVQSNKIYENAFEWRFEFPEVLNDDGDFVGFDVVIGNPPYGVRIEGSLREFLVNNVSKVPDYEIYYWFIDRAHLILKNKGTLSYIIPNTILFNVFAEEYRVGLFDNWDLLEIIDCTDIKIFEDATVRNIILTLSKGNTNDKLGYRRTNGIVAFRDLISEHRKEILKDFVEENSQNWGLIFKLNEPILQLTSKIRNNKLLKEYFSTSQGYIPYRRRDLIKEYGKKKGNQIVDERLWHSDQKENQEYKQEIFGRNISKYNFNKTESYVWYGEHLATYVDPKYFSSKRILVREITNPKIIALLLKHEFVNDPQLISIIKKENIEDEFSLELLWAILNSKLATFYHFNSSPKATKGEFPKILVTDLKNFPVPDKRPVSIVDDIKKKMDKASSLKHGNPEADTSKFEAQIDQLVYELYDLTEDEIEMIENA